jgi:hypothetical protein
MYGANALGPSGASGARFSAGSTGLAAAGGEAPDKYIVKNGVKKMNPEYKQWQKSQNASLPLGDEDRVPKQIAEYSQPDALAIISTPEDHTAAVRLSDMNGVMVCHAAQAVTDTQEIFAEEAHHFGVKGLDGEELLTGLYEKFAAWQIPRGFVNKLALTMKSDSDPCPDEPKRIYLQDDSGSMNEPSDITDDAGRNQTRFQEAEQRILSHLEFLAFVPNTGKIQIRFLNRPDVVTLNRPLGQSPEDFLAESRLEIRAAFSRAPTKFDLTPIASKLGELIDNRKGKQSITLLFDGEPRDGYTDKEVMINQMRDKVMMRPDPHDCPITFLSCTNDAKEVEWAKELEEVAPFCAEYDDFKSEVAEVERDQGKALPYSPGMKIISEIVGAECPHDLDKWDESVPMTQHTLEQTMGTDITKDEYKYYYQHFEKPNRDPATGKDKNQLWKTRFAEFAVTERDNPHQPLVAADMPIVQQHQEQERAALLQKTAQTAGRQGSSSSAGALGNKLRQMLVSPKR